MELSEPAYWVSPEDKLGPFKKTRETYDRRRDRAASAASEQTYKLLDKELRRICSRLRPGREVSFMDAMGSVSVTIQTEHEQYSITPSDRVRYPGPGKGPVSVDPIPLFGEIRELLVQYNFATENDFTAAEWPRFTT